ncbi:MAG: hypothetical protein ACERK1_13840, partial [Anaerolineales bacterium]
LCKCGKGQVKAIEPYPGRPVLRGTGRQGSAAAIVVDGVTTIRGEQGNLLTGRRAERQAVGVLRAVRGTSKEDRIPRIGELLDKRNG